MHSHVHEQQVLQQLVQQEDGAVFGPAAGMQQEELPALKQLDLDEDEVEGGGHQLQRRGQHKGKVPGRSAAARGHKLASDEGAEEGSVLAESSRNAQPGGLMQHQKAKLKLRLGRVVM